MIIGIMVMIAAVAAAVGGGMEHAKRKGVKRAGQAVSTIGHAVGAATPWVEEAIKHKR